MKQNKVNKSIKDNKIKDKGIWFFFNNYYNEFSYGLCEKIFRGQ